VGLFSRIKNGVSSRANAALDKAIDPEKEIDMAILELEEQRKKALAELLAYKTTAKQMDQDLERHAAKIGEWEKRAMLAVSAGDDHAARQALREKKNCEVEAIKIRRDKMEAAGYAVELNKSRKAFEVRLQTLKLRKGTLASQIAAARAGGDLLGQDGKLFERFQAAEERIDQVAIESEVDAAMRGDVLTAGDAEFDQKLLAATGGQALGAGADDALAALKAKMEADRSRRKELASSTPAASDGAGSGGGDGGNDPSAPTTKL
jgi:phage shock protein A